MKLENFPLNKYAKHYIRLIETRRNQKREKFKTESHHIFPVSIFGTNKERVNLTHKEHFIAHLLLWKMYQKEFGSDYFATKKMAKTVFYFNCNHRKLQDKQLQNKMCSKLYQNLREQFQVINSEQTTKLHQEGKFDNNLEWLADYWKIEDNRNAQSERRKQWCSIPENKEKQKETNKKLTNTPKWKEQRRLKQIEFSSDPEYTKKRIDAMNRPEIKEKVARTQKLNAAAMSKEERSARFGRIRTAEQIAEHANKIKGRKRYYNVETLEIKMFQQPPDSNIWKTKQELNLLAVIT